MYLNPSTLSRQTFTNYYRLRAIAPGKYACSGYVVDERNQIDELFIYYFEKVKSGTRRATSIHLCQIKNLYN